MLSVGLKLLKQPSTGHLTGSLTDLWPTTVTHACSTSTHIRDTIAGNPYRMLYVEPACHGFFQAVLVIGETHYSDSLLDLVLDYAESRGLL